jgi:hypothetical protein
MDIAKAVYAALLGGPPHDGNVLGLPARQMKKR